MKSIYEICANKTMAAPGEWAYEAEAKVCGPDSTDEVFVHVGWYDGMRNYQVSKESMVQHDTKNDLGADPDVLKMVDDLWTMDLNEYCKKYANGPDDADDSVLEEYEKISAAKESAYYKVFKVLDGLVKAMADEIG